MSALQWHCHVSSAACSTCRVSCAPVALEKAEALLQDSKQAEKPDFTALVSAAAAGLRYTFEYPAGWKQEVPSKVGRHGGCQQLCVRCCAIAAVCRHLPAVRITPNVVMAMLCGVPSVYNL
jgi:hypothetical protein